MILRKKTHAKKFAQRIRRLRNTKHKFASVMDEYKKGRLYSSAGSKVTNPKQARAIAYNMSYGPRKTGQNKAVKRTLRIQRKRQGLLGRLKGLIQGRK